MTPQSLHLSRCLVQIIQCLCKGWNLPAWHITRLQFQHQVMEIDPSYWIHWKYHEIWSIFSKKRIKNPFLTHQLLKQIKIYLSHNIIQIHNNVMWDWQYFIEYSPHSVRIWGNIMYNIVCPTKHCYGFE